MRAKAIVKICICGTIALVLASMLVSLLALPRVLDWKIGDLSFHWIDDHGSDEGYTVGEASVSGEVRELDVSSALRQRDSGADGRRCRDAPRGAAAREQ